MTPVVGHPGYYVNHLGFVFSEKYGSLRELKRQPDERGYLHVVLSTAGKAHTISVQSLVATHFIGPRPEGYVVCHCDGDKTNNASWNLRYDTQKGNIADIKLHGTQNPPQGSKNGMSRLTEAQVLEMRRLRRLYGLTHRALGFRFGISREQARDIINRKAWRHV